MKNESESKNSSTINVSSVKETPNSSRKSENVSEDNSESSGPFHDIATSWRDHPSAFSPYRPTTVLTNLQRGNVQTQTLTIPIERGVHQLAAQGELFLGNIDDTFDPNCVDKNGFTPLMWAAAYGQLETVRTLINAKASVSTLAPTGENALLFACAAGYCAIVKELLNHGAEIDYKDKEGNTALMYAVYNDHAACVQELLNAGADFTILNEALESAYDVAIRRRSKNAQVVLEKCALSLLVDASET